MADFKNFDDVHEWLNAVCRARQELRGNVEAEEFLTEWARDIYGPRFGEHMRKSIHDINSELLYRLAATAQEDRASLLKSVVRLGRTRILELLVWNDPNGVWSDADRDANDYGRLSLPEAAVELVLQIEACVEGR